MCHPGHPGVQVRGGPGSHAQTLRRTSQPSSPQTLKPSQPLQMEPSPGARGGRRRSSALGESRRRGGVCVGTRLCGPWSLVPRGRCVEAAVNGLLYDFVRDLTPPSVETRSTPVRGTWPGKCACPAGARPILQRTVSFTARNRPPGPPRTARPEQAPLSPREASRPLPADSTHPPPRNRSQPPGARYAPPAGGNPPHGNPPHGGPPAAGAPGRRGRPTRRRRSPCRGPASSVPAARASRSGGCARA
jgi:hypothetical protein